MAQTMDFGKVLTAVLQPSIYRATKYVSPTRVIKATRHRFQGKLLTSRARQETVLVTIGKPNYRERRFIKLCQLAKESFPLRKIQIKHLPCNV